MLIFSLVSLLLSNSFTLRRDKSILYSRVTMSILIIATLITNDNLYFLFLNKGIGVFGGLYYFFILLGKNPLLGVCILTKIYPCICVHFTLENPRVHRFASITLYSSPGSPGSPFASGHAGLPFITRSSGSQDSQSLSGSPVLPGSSGSQDSQSSSGLPDLQGLSGSPVLQGPPALPAQYPLPAQFPLQRPSSLPTEYYLPGQNPLPGQLRLPGQYPLPTEYILPSRNPLPGQYPLPSQTPLPAQFPLQRPSGIPGQYPLHGQYPLPAQYTLPGPSSVQGPSGVPRSVGLPGPSGLPGTPYYHNTEWQRLWRDMNDCKEEWKEADKAFKDLRKAIHLDKMLIDTSKNKSMRDIMEHYKEFFDKESGNTKSQGIDEIQKELVKDCNIKIDAYKKARKNLDSFNPNSQNIMPLIPFNKLTFAFVKNMFSYITLFISVVNLTLWLQFIFDFDPIFIPDLLLDLRDYILNLVKYEIVYSIFTFAWSMFTFYKKYQKYRLFLANGLNSSFYQKNLENFVFICYFYLPILIIIVIILFILFI